MVSLSLCFYYAIYSKIYLYLKLFDLSSQNDSKLDLSFLLDD